MVKIFVGRLPEEATKEELEKMFKEFGEIMDCCVLKGYAFVHMTEVEDAKKAIEALDKKQIHGCEINVELSTTRVQKATKLFVGNLPEGTKSAEIHKLFKEYGTVIECDVVKNFAFVHMSRDNMARDAIKGLNKFDLNGNQITVQMARQKNEMNDWYGGGFRGGFRGGRGGGFRGGMGGMRGGWRGGWRGDPYMMGGMGGGPMMGRGGFRGGRGRGGMGGGYGGGFRQDMQMREQMMMEREAYGRQLVGGDNHYGGYDDYSANSGGGYDFTSDQTGGDGNGFGLW